MKETFADIKRNHAQISIQVHMFELWHLYVERVLRQRTVASFEEILLRSDRNVVYRGSVQKFLFLADALMNDFAVKITGQHDDPPRLWAMYDSTTRIFSYPSMGLVRIPARHLFRLASILPDLWHEVGVYRFYSKVYREDLYTEDSVTKTRRLVSDEEYQTLGDRYGDLVVYNFGFDGKSPRFMVSLVRSWFDAFDVDKISPALYEEEFKTLLVRLAFTVGVSNEWRDPFGRGTGALGFHECLNLIESAYESIRAIFADPKKPKLLPRLSDDAILRVAGRVWRELAEFGPPLAKWFRATLEIPVNGGPSDQYKTMIETADGQLVTFSLKDDMNAVFGELYWQLRRKLVQKVDLVTPFQRTAAITRSSIIEYHRRQARLIG